MHIHHLALRTVDVARLVTFYTEVFGLEVRARHGERSVWLTAGRALVMIEKATAGEPPIPAGSMELVAFAVTADEVAAKRARLRAARVAIEAETPFTIYVRDPDGRRVALSHFAVESESASAGG